MAIIELDISDSLMEEINGLVAKGEYASIEEFIEEAIRNYLRKKNANDDDKSYLAYEVG